MRAVVGLGRRRWAAQTGAARAPPPEPNGCGLSGPEGWLPHGPGPLEMETAISNGVWSHGDVGPQVGPA